MLITRFGSIASQSVSAGGIDAYVKSMLHFNGTDGSTTFTDEISRTWTAYGNAQLDTAQKKFGTASGLFDGTGDYIDTPDSEDFNVGSGDFTFDFWFKLNSGGTYQTVFAQIDSSGTISSGSVRLYIDLNNKPILRLHYSSSVIETSVGSTALDSTWRHIAGVRYQNTLKTYVDGTLQGSADVTGITVNNSTNKFTIGRNGEYATNYLNGWVDEFRFSKGIARWTSDFTPYATEYVAA